MLPVNIDKTINDISIARISSYYSFFPQLTPEEVYGVYCWNEALSSVFFRLISITEIVLRNRFHESFSQVYYNSESTGSKSANDWYNHVSLNKKSNINIQKVTHRRKKNQFVPRNPLPSPNDVISQMTFGFWPALLIEESIDKYGELIPNIVPYHRYRSESYWKKSNNRGVLWARLDMVNKLRNRIAHFEPLWKQGDMYEERRRNKNSPDLEVILPAPVDTLTSIQMLAIKHEKVLELLKWLSKERAQDYLRSYIKDHFSWLCSIEGFESYKSLKVGKIMPLSRFKRDMNSIVCRQDKVNVTNSGGHFGTFYPGYR